MYLRAPGMDSSVARRRETGSGGRSRGLMEERPLKGNIEERPDMSVKTSELRPAIGRVSRLWEYDTTQSRAQPIDPGPINPF